MRTAVVLFNLGGASSLETVQPYLYNIFSDPAIINLPNPLRAVFAWMLSRLRNKKTQAIYQMIGGKSTLLENTQKQAAALEGVLGEGYRVFIAMRYWHPRAEHVFAEIKKYQPQHIVLLPLYPQYSTTTTASSVREFKKYNTSIPYEIIDSYPESEGFIDAMGDLIRKEIRNINEPYRILFTAHGIPLKTIQAGDPYQKHVEATVAKVVSKLNIKELDCQICYQSRVGYLPWLQPYTIDEIKRAGDQKKAIVVVPISFVSENSETLYELDMQYRELAKKLGTPGYYRVQTVSEHPRFIQGLADLVKKRQDPDAFKESA
jgi:ferrochelatase